MTVIGAAIIGVGGTTAFGFVMYEEIFQLATVIEEPTTEEYRTTRVFVAVPELGESKDQDLFKRLNATRCFPTGVDISLVKFDFRKQDRFDWIKIEEVQFDVLSYEPLDGKIVWKTESRENTEVISTRRATVDIGGRKDKFRKTLADDGNFIATGDKPIPFVASVNVKTKGIYTLQCEIVVSRGRMSQTLQIGKPIEVVFGPRIDPPGAPKSHEAGLAPEYVPQAPAEAAPAPRDP